MPNASPRAILDNDPIDRLIVMAAAMLDAPIAAVAVDIGGTRVLRSLRDGLITERAGSECGEVSLDMGSDGTLVIPDLTADSRTAGNEFVRGPAACRFYAGASIMDETGHRIGSLCVLDTVVRSAPSADLMRLLRMLAEQAASAVTQLNLMRAQEERTELLRLGESLLGLGHWRLDFLTGQLTWSDEVYRIHGLDRATFDPGLDDALAAYHPDDRPVIVGHVERARATGEGFECRLRLLRPDGGLRLTQSTGRCLAGEDGKPVALFGVFQDITDRDLADQRLKDSEERFRLMASNVSDIVATYGVDGVFTYLSPSLFAALGYRPEEFVGRSVNDLIHPDDVSRTWAAFARYLAAPAGTPAPRIPYRAIGKDGAIRWFEAHPTVIRDEAGRPVEIQDLVRDVTAAKDLEQTLMKAREEAERATKAKSDFLANMSHEIRTPLTAILGFSSLLTGRDDIPDDARVHVDRIGRAGQALLSIVNDVLDFSKLEAGQYELRAETCDPLEVCHEALLMFAPLAAEKGLSLDFSQIGDLPAHVELDPHKLRQILLNLVGNAIKFTDAGSVAMTIRHDADRAALSVSVRDTGAGMDEQQCARLFQRFSQVDASSTRKHGGTGLGLAICKGLSEAMGGGISVTSQPGLGSTFSFTVLAPPTQGVSTATPQDCVQALDLDGLRLLVVDDNPANREIVSALTGRLGVEVSEAASGQEAISLASHQPFDVILMDLRMPGMGGDEAARSIRSRPGPNQSIPILGFSADSPGEFEGRTDFDGLVAKPIVLSELIQAIVLSLHGQPPASLDAAGAA